jgi:tripartite-type tricarboxylate transporter receptor subunit TctC
MKKKGFVVFAACLLVVMVFISSMQLMGASAKGASSVDPAKYLKGKTIRVVIGSTAVTGDTYLTADLVTRMISQKYGCRIKVDPIGAGRALEQIVTTKADGSTIMMFHDMTYLGVLFGAYKEADYKLEKMVVGGTFGYNPGDCFAASASAPYKTIKEMADWMKANPNQTVRLAVEAGGVSQLGFNSIYGWIKDTYGADVASRLKAFVTGSTDEKLQALWDGNCQGIYAATSAIEEYTKEGVDAQLKVNIIGLMAGQRVEGRTWPTFAEQGITLNGKPYAFTKEYFVFYPTGISKEYVAAMDAAMEAVCNSAEYKAEIEKLGYKAQFMDSEDANDHIYEKREAFRKLIEDAPSFDDLVG